VQIQEESSMKTQLLGMACFAMLLAGTARAQTKISGTVQCAKPDPAYSLEVGDRPGHTMMLQKGPCTWSKPMEIASAKTKSDLDTFFTEATATRATSNGSVVGTLDSGDKMFVSTRDTAPVKNGKPGDAQGTWSFTGGTGKIAGIKGKGTYTLKQNADGSAVAEVEGEYTLASSASAKAPKAKAK
jgi:hypothetical protein